MRIKFNNTRGNDTLRPRHARTKCGNRVVLTTDTDGKGHVWAYTEHNGAADHLWTYPSRAEARRALR